MEDTHRTLGDTMMVQMVYSKYVMSPVRLIGISLMKFKQSTASEIRNQILRGIKIKAIHFKGRNNRFECLEIVCVFILN